MFRHTMNILGLAAVLCAGTALSGCDRTLRDYWSAENPARLGIPANMIRRQVESGPFLITVAEKVHKNGGVANIYIEGDGDRALPGAKTTARNPTPAYPVALHLATRDLADNVIYLARPCQFSGSSEQVGMVCKKDYWTNDRFGIESVDAMNTVLDKLRTRYGFSGFNLIGYDGGGTIAALLAAKRHDILTLRTVAGNLDPNVNNANHKIGPMGAASLNPKDFAKELASLPQHHFIGDWDMEMLPNVYQSYKDSMGASSCIRVSTVGEVEHDAGWANRWPSLLEQPVDCMAK